MTCHGCISLPDDAIVLARSTTECKIIYRVGEVVTKILRDTIPPAIVEKKQRLAAMHPDVIEQIQYDLPQHRIQQLWRGSENPTDEEYTHIHKIVAERFIPISDLKVENIRGGKLIDFDFYSRSLPEERRVGAFKKQRGLYIHAASESQVRAVQGKQIIWPNG